MATARASTHRIQVQHILISLVGTLTVILFAASIVLLTIGYQNPFGTVGLGILGGGCVVFFSTVLFLCACSIWIKNKYYGDETDYKEKLIGRPSEEITLLKPASSERPETEHEKDDKNNPVPLYSVSTIYSSVSSSSANIPEILNPCNWQEEDMAGVLDSDVFSSSLTALQYGDMKLQQRLEPAKSSSDLLIGGNTGHNKQNMKDEQKRLPANNNENLVSDLPRQRRPMAMDSPCYVPHGNSNIQIELPLTDVQNTKTKAHFSTDKSLCDENTQPCPVDTSKTTAAAFQRNACKGNHKKDQAADHRNRNNGKQNLLTADKQGSSTTASDPVIQNTTRTNKQGITRKDLIPVLAGNLEKNNDDKEMGKCNQESNSKSLQGSSPKSSVDQSANVQVPSHVTRVEVPTEKTLITKKQDKPGTRTNQ